MAMTDPLIHLVCADDLGCGQMFVQAACSWPQWGRANANPAVRQMRLPQIKTYMRTYHVDAVKRLLSFPFPLRTIKAIRMKL